MLKLLLNEIKYWAAYNEYIHNIKILYWKFNDLLNTVGDAVGNSCLILHLNCMSPNLLITGITLKGKNGQWAPVKNPHPLAVPHENTPNAVRIQTYQGLLRDLRTRSKTCRRTQSKLNLTSTSSLRL